MNYRQIEVTIDDKPPVSMWVPTQPSKHDICQLLMSIGAQFADEGHHIHFRIGREETTL